MAYRRDLERAAERHLEAAEHLFDKTHRHDVAGYLYGIAAECALKQIMRRSGMQELDNQQRRDLLVSPQGSDEAALLSVLQTILRSESAFMTNAIKRADRQHAPVVARR